MRRFEESSHKAESRLPSDRFVDQADEITDAAMGFDGVSESLSGADAIAILPPDFFSLKKAFRFQISDDALHGPFSNANLGRDFSQDQGRVTREQDQDVGIVGEERPTVGRLACCGTRRCGSRRCGSRRWDTAGWSPRSTG